MLDKKKQMDLNPHGVPYVDDIFTDKEIKEINKWIKIYNNKLFFFKEKEAIKKLKEYDQIYCTRAKLTLDDLYNIQIQEIKRIASIKFSDIKNEFNDTMFDYSEDNRAAAYKRFEKKYLDLVTEQEKKFPFKAVIASDMGLVRRKYLWF